MPVWKFNQLQTTALIIQAQKRKHAEELRTLAGIAASLGHKQTAMDCYLYSVELDNPDISNEKKKFEIESKRIFDSFKKKFPKSGKTAKPKKPVNEDWQNLQRWISTERRGT